MLEKPRVGVSIVRLCETLLDVSTPVARDEVKGVVTVGAQRKLPNLKRGYFVACRRGHFRFF